MLKECFWDVVAAKGTDNKGTGEWCRSQGVRCFSAVGCKSKLWQV